MCSSRSTASVPLLSGTVKPTSSLSGTNREAVRGAMSQIAYLLT